MDENDEIRTSVSVETENSRIKQQLQFYYLLLYVYVYGMHIVQCIQIICVKDAITHYQHSECEVICILWNKFF